MTGEATGAALPGRPLVIAALGATLLLGTHHLVHLGRPWGGGIVEEICAVWMGRGTRLGAEVPLERGAGLLVWQRVPGTDLLRFYGNHPPLAGWLARLSWKVLPHGGDAPLTDEAAVRAPFLLATLLLVLLVPLALRRQAPAAGWLAALLLATTPGLLELGAIANFEPWCVLLSTAAAFRYAAWRRDPTPSGRRWTWVLLFLAVLADWPAAFLLVPVAADLLIARPRNRRTLLLLATAPLAAFVLHWGLVAFAERSLAAASAGLAGAVAKTYVLNAPPSTPPGTPFDALPALAGWPLLALAAGGLVLLSRPHAAALRRPVLLLGALALLNAALFAWHARVHLYWNLYFLPPLALLGALATAALLRAGLRRPPLAVALLVVLLAALALSVATGLQRHARALAGSDVVLAEPWRERFDREDVVVATVELRHMAFWVDTAVFRLVVPTPERLQELLDDLPPGRPVHLVLLDGDRSAHPELARFAEENAVETGELPSGRVHRMR